MTCRDISNASVSSYDTLQQMYVGLGIRRLPTGVYMNVDSAVPSGGINLGLITPESLECFDTLAGITGGASYNGTSLHGNVRDIRALIDYFRGAGNTGDANVITGEEIDAYVTAYGEGRRDFDAQEYRDLTVSNIAAYVAIVQYVGGEDPAIPTTSGNPAEANTAAIHSFGSVQQMFTGLVGETSGEGANASRSSVAEDMPAEGIPLGVLNETNIQRFADAVGWDPTAEPTTPLSRNALEILTLVDYFRTDGNLEGNDPDVITSAEVDAYVRAYVDNAHASGDRTLTFDDYRAITVGNLRAIVACVQHISNPPTVVAVAPDAGSPDGGVPVADAGVGPRVVAETPVDGGASSPIAARPAPESEMPSWLGYLCAGIGGGLALLGAGTGLGWMLRGGRNTAAPARPASATSPAPAADPAPATRAPKTAPAAPAVSPPAPPPLPVVPPAASAAPADDDMDDVLRDIAAQSSQQTPSGTSSLPGAAPNTVTADNVIINGTSAAPVNGVDSAVVRSQVVLHFRRFLSQTAREALQSNRDLPTGTELVNESFEREVNEITDRIVAEYYTRHGSAEGREGLSDLWRSQLEDRGYIVRRGVPQRLLLEVANTYINEHSSSASSPFAGGAGVEMTREAERHAGESRFLEEGMREIMRMSGR